MKLTLCEADFLPEYSRELAEEIRAVIGKEDMTKEELEAVIEAVEAAITGLEIDRLKAEREIREHECTVGFPYSMRYSPARALLYRTQLKQLRILSGMLTKQIELYKKTLKRLIEIKEAQE